MKNIRLLRGSNNIRGIQIMGWEGERGSKGIGRTIINIHLPRTGGREQVSKEKIGRKTRGQVGFLSRVERPRDGKFDAGSWMIQTSDRINVKYVRFLRVF